MDPLISMIGFCLEMERVAEQILANMLLGNIGSASIINMLMLEFGANHSCIWGYYLYSHISLTADNLLVALSNQLKQNDYLLRPPAASVAALLHLLAIPRCSQ